MNSSQDHQRSMPDGHAGLERVPDDQPYWGPGRILASFAVVSLIAFWVGIWSFALLSDKVEKNPDELADQTFLARADAECQRAKAEIDALPPASTVKSPAERADLLERSNPIVASMVRQLAVITVDNEGDQIVVDKWIADWNIYVSDREAHVDRLRTEGDVRFQITDSQGVHITERIDGFARVNDMDHCEIPLDL